VSHFSIDEYLYIRLDQI